MNNYNYLNKHQKIIKFLISPPENSKTSAAFRKISYYKKANNAFIAPFFSSLAQRALVVAIPALALIDAVSYGTKSIKFFATLQFDQSVIELIKMIKCLAIAILGVVTFPIGLVSPSLFYRNQEEWQSKMLRNLTQKIVFHELTERNNQPMEAISKETVELAFRNAINEHIKNEDVKKSLNPIVNRLLNEMNFDKKEEIELVFNTNAHWLALFLIECQVQKLSLETIDKHFFSVIESLNRLKKPDLREKLTLSIIKDYANKSDVTLKFQNYIAIFDKKREEDIQLEVKTLKEAKKTGNQNASVKLEQTKQRLEKQKTTLENALSTARLELDKVVSLDDQKTTTLKSKIQGMETRLGSIQEEMNKIVNDSDNLPNQPIDDFEMLIEKKAREKNPELNSQTHYFLKLYFLLRNCDLNNNETLESYIDIIKAPKFKDAAHGDKLLNFFYLLSSAFDNTIQVKTLDILSSCFKKDDATKKNTLQAIVNALTILNLNLSEKFKEIVDSKTSASLDSLTLVAELFAEKVVLTGEKKYEGENGRKELNKDYQKTIGAFRDPSVILTYLSTLSNLTEPDRTKSIKAFTDFVTHVLHGTLKTWRHDTERSEHLKLIFKKEGLKEKWMNCSLRAVDNFPSYSIGETEDPCDLIMQSVEIEGSCLHVGGRPQKNKGLLGHLLDGKTHTLVVKDKAGVIAARTLLKILWNDKEKKPVLVLPNTYTSNDTNKKLFQQWIVEYCINRSKELGLDLVTTDASLGQDPYGKVSSKGNPAPFEYLEYTMSNGIYTIGTFKLA